MSSGPELSLVCKSCGAEVSPYITECPYCGARVHIAVAGGDVVLGANGAALGMLAAWSMRDVLGRRAGREDESDLLGVLAIAAVLVLLPLVTDEASGLAGVTGGVIGIVLGLVLAQLPER